MELEQSKHALPGLKEKRLQQKKDILTFFYKQGRLSKPEICRMTNMTAPTINRIINELIETRWVVDCGEGISVGGKRPHLFCLNPDAAYVLGVDLGRVHLKIALFNLHREVIGKIHTFPSMLERASNQENLTYLQEKTREVIIRSGVPRDRVKVAGVAVPGLIDKEGNSYTYLMFENSSLKKELERLLGMPVLLDHDSNVMSIAEHTFGAAKGSSNALCISVSECIGMGMILNGKPYSGALGMAGEFGHIRLSGVDLPCYCGKTGCLESVASGRAIVTAAREAIRDGKKTAIEACAAGEEVTLTHVITAAIQDDIFAIELLQRAGEKIGEGIATLVHLFNPQLLVIGGEIAGAGEHITAPVLQAVNKYTLSRLRSQCELRLSTLNTRSVIMGTLMMVMQDLYYDGNSDFFQLTMQFKGN
ncbi:MAG: ROK family transcriptional regulator [Odoribacteraceae bacterium]|jgi:predicted NBD/HSP70 family sugar kinase|nr:ROK family transcriptional regulator [Odoribacteraceae bacterium]